MLDTAVILTAIPDDTRLRAYVTGNGTVDFLWPGTAAFASELSACVVNPIALYLPLADGLRVDLPRVPVLNHLADPDRYAGALRAALQVVGALGTPCFNHPEAVLRTTRDGVADALAGLDGLIVPKTIRLSPKRPTDIHRAIWEHGLRYPVIMRLVGTQSRQTQVLVRSKDDDKSIYSVPWGGQSIYLTQFENYMDRHGWFRKARIVWLGGQVRVRSLMSSRHWAVGGSVADASQNHIEEKFISNSNDGGLEVYRNIFEKITDKIQLDMFAMDCSFLDDGRILLFEATASASIFQAAGRIGIPSIAIRQIEVVKQEFYHLITNPNLWRYCT